MRNMQRKWALEEWFSFSLQQIIKATTQNVVGFYSFWPEYIELLIRSTRTLNTYFYILCACASIWDSGHHSRFRRICTCSNECSFMLKRIKIYFWRIRFFKSLVKFGRLWLVSQRILEKQVSFSLEDAKMKWEWMMTWKVYKGNGVPLYNRFNTKYCFKVHYYKKNLLNLMKYLDGRGTDVTLRVVSPLLKNDSKIDMLRCMHVSRISSKCIQIHQTLR